MRNGSRYKVGDIVQIKPNLKERFGVVSQMVRLAGKDATIVEDLGGSYKIDLDKRMFFWWDNCFVNTRKISDEAWNELL